MILNYLDKIPVISRKAFIFKNAVLSGDITVGDFSSVWFGTVIRGDVNFVKIGSGTNIQDNSCIHVTTEKFPTIIGDNVTVGHAVTVHGSVIDSNVLIGMGSVLLDGCRVKNHSILAAGSVLKPGTTIPEGVLAAGNPAEIKRELKPEERAFFKKSADSYIKYSERYLTYSSKSIYTYDEIFDILDGLKSYTKGEQK
ncbi:MAG: gamma carbonic anhydrase family protein [bacterium]